MTALLVLLTASLANADGGVPAQFAVVDATGPTRLVLHGALTKVRQQAVVGRAEAVVADVARRFTPKPVEPKRDVHVFVFEKTADYRAFADGYAGLRPSELGFYLPARRLVVVNLQYGLRNLAHELVHALVGDDFPNMPSWLNEGLGSLYGGADPTTHGMRFTVNYRMRDVQAALKAGTLPSLGALAAATSDDVYGDEVMVWYGLARAALLYLASTGELSSFYAAARGGEPLERALASRVDEARFHAFVRRARKSDPVAEPR